MSLRSASPDSEPGSRPDLDLEPAAETAAGGEAFPAEPGIPIEPAGEDSGESSPDADIVAPEPLGKLDPDSFRGRSETRASATSGPQLERLLETFPSGVGRYFRERTDARTGKKGPGPLPRAPLSGRGTDAIMRVKKARKYLEDRATPRDEADK